MPESLRRSFLILLLLFSCMHDNYAQTGTITKEFLLGKYDYTQDTSFTRVERRYTRNVVYLKKATCQAFLKMHDAALKDGVRLTIISGTRSFYDQHNKWEAEWNDPKFYGVKNGVDKVKKLLQWWSMPGTSRHHWGTDVDLTNISPAFFNTARGRKMYDWMSKNAARFGFYQPFNANRRDGYREEKWHWSYLPLARVYLAEYSKRVTYEDIYGFPGSGEARELDVINSRVLAVNPECK